VTVAGEELNRRVALLYQCKIRANALTLISRPPRPSLNCLAFEENMACVPMKFGARL